MRSRAPRQVGLALFLLIPIPADALSAQDVRFGAHAAYGSESSVGVGGRLLVPLTAGDLHLHIGGAVDFFLPHHSTADLHVFGDVVQIGEGSTLLESRVIGLLDIPVDAGSAAPYAGVGLHRYSYGSTLYESTDGFGVDLIGGVRFESDSGGLTPFAELRYEGNDIGQIVITGGVLF